MVPVTLLTTLLLVLAVSANPVVVKKPLVTLPISRRVNATNAFNLLRHDQARAKALISKAKARADGTHFLNDAVINSPADNNAVSYIASVGVGCPATTYNLVVDTGSSNTWLGASKAYVKTETSRKTSNSVSVRYGTASFSGTEYTDQVTLAPGLVIRKQSIGVASNSTGLNTGVDGILGIGPTILTLGTLSPDSNTTIPTVIDNLFSGGQIDANEIGVYFEPITSSSGEQLNGEITWGGVDSSKYTGEITFAPITTAYPANEYWGIDQSIVYGNTTILSATSGIVDTGTTLILIATDAFGKYVSATGSDFDNDSSLLTITPAQFARLQSLFFIVNGVSFELTPNAQIWPRALNTNIGGIAGKIYLIVADIGIVSGFGLDFINGQTFLERFYSVYDVANPRVGLATTAFTYATTN